MLLATWFKRTLKTSLLGQIYANKAKTKGLGYMSSRNQTHMSSPNAFIGDPQYIYQQYIKAYKKGVFNFIKEDMDKYTNETVPRKYFSGGAGSFDMAQATFGRNVIGITDNEAVGNPAMFHDEEKMDMATVALERNGAMNAPDAAMTSERGQRADRAMMTQERLTTVDALGIISKVFTEKELTNTWDLQGNLNVGKLLLFKPHKEFLASVWLPHFQQIMQERGLSSQEFMREINEEKFDAETIKFLKAPLSNGGNVRSQNEEIVGMDTEAFKKELIERIGVLAKSGDHRLKVDLGGTLYQEINNVTDILERTLEEVARENGVTDPIGAHEWIKGWQVRIRGMSLNTSYLYYMRRSIDNSGDFFQRKWVQLEYIDLLDQRQWPRLTQDPADLLIVSRSLYLGKWNFLMQGSLEKDLNMAFLNNVDKFVKSKGIFVTEIPRTDQVERGLEPAPMPSGFNGVMTSDGHRSGVFTKNAAMMHRGAGEKDAAIISNQIIVKDKINRLGLKIGDIVRLEYGQVDLDLGLINKQESEGRVVDLDQDVITIHVDGNDKIFPLGQSIWSNEQYVLNDIDRNGLTETSLWEKMVTSIVGNMPPRRDSGAPGLAIIQDRKIVFASQVPLTKEDLIAKSRKLLLIKNAISTSRNLDFQMLPAIMMRVPAFYHHFEEWALIGQFILELIGNALYRGRKDGKILSVTTNLTFYESPLGHPVLQLEISQPYIGEGWDMIRENARLPLDQLVDKKSRPKGKFLLNQGMGLGLYAFLAIRKRPMRLEYQRIKNGMKTTLWIMADQTPESFFSPAEGRARRREGADGAMAANLNIEDNSIGIAGAKQRLGGILGFLDDEEEPKFFNELQSIKDIDTLMDFVLRLLLHYKFESFSIIYHGLLLTKLQQSINPQQVDYAMKGVDQTIPGGIDLNSANLAMTIKRDGNGMPMLSQQDLAQLSRNMEGLDPVIISIKPASQTALFEELVAHP